MVQVTLAHKHVDNRPDRVVDINLQSDTPEDLLDSTW